MNQQTVRVLEKLLDKETVFFDIGAHIGQYTLLAAPLTREVHCFEPMPWIYKILEYNVSRNKLKNVRCKPVGVTDYTGSADVWQGPKDNTEADRLCEYRVCMTAPILSIALRWTITAK
jgi:FkbM family methyltransferase